MHNMKKRGDLITISIITIILAVVIALMLPKVAKDKATGVIALKTASARDIALTLNVMCSSPYDVKAKQSLRLEGFILQISDNQVKLHDKRYVYVENNRVIGKDPTMASYPFSCQSRVDSILDSPKILVVTKKDRDLFVTKENDDAKV